MNPRYSIAVTGQSLIRRDIGSHTHPGFAAVRRAISSASCAFTNFEASVYGQHGGNPQKEDFFHGTDAEVLGALRSLGFDILSLANNHAFDLGPEGILSTLDEASRRGFAHAGTGRDLEDASRPGYSDDQGFRVGLVAMDCGPQPDTVYARNATNCEYGRPGVNPLRIVGQTPRPDPHDLSRNMQAIGDARRRCDFLITYVHNHHWHEPIWRTPEWVVHLAHNCVDEGTDLFVAHGAPVLQGVEIYRRRPVFYSLGNFIFHTTNADRWGRRVGPRAWQSVLALCDLDHRWRPSGIRLIPIAIGHDSDPEGKRIPQFHDLPVTVPTAYGRRIVEQLEDLSDGFGTDIAWDGDTARIDIG